MERSFIIKNSLILILGVIAIFATVQGIKVGYQYFITAEEVSEPKDIRLTNLSDNSAVLSWVTDKKITGFVVWGTAPDSVSESQKSEEKTKIHYFNLKNLRPATVYYYKIGSGSKLYDQNGVAFNFTTAPIASSPPTPDEVYGWIKTSSGKPAAQVLAYLVIKDQDGQGSSGTSTTLSALTRPTGTFAVDLGNARTTELSSYFVYSRTADQVTIEAQGGDLGSKQLIISTSQAQPLPEIVLSPTGGLADLSSQPLTPEQTVSQETRTQPLTKEKEATLKVVVPQIISLDEKAALAPGSVVSGTASPGATLTIIIQSEPISTQVTADENGNWSYTLPSNLTSGEHTITISDENGSDAKNFVLAGASEEPETTSVASPSALPLAGNISTTLFLLTTAVILLFLGVRLALI